MSATGRGDGERRAAAASAATVENQNGAETRLSSRVPLPDGLVLISPM